MNVLLLYIVLIERNAVKLELEILFIPAPKRYEVQRKRSTPGEDKEWEVNRQSNISTLSTSHTNKWEAEQEQADFWRTCRTLSTAAFAFLPNYL